MTPLPDVRREHVIWSITEESARDDISLHFSEERAAAILAKVDLASFTAEYADALATMLANDEWLDECIVRPALEHAIEALRAMPGQGALEHEEREVA